MNRWQLHNNCCLIWLGIRVYFGLIYSLINMKVKTQMHFFILE